MAVGFIFGEGQKARTPEDLKRQRAIVDSLRRRTDYTPKTIGEAIGYIGDAISEYRANKDLEAGEAASADRGKSLMGEIVGALGNGGGSTGYSGGNVGMPEAAGGSGNYRDAIAGIESGGRYDAVGPTHKTLGRALGKYQVMEANIGPWSEKYLGRRISSDEFLANPKLQDAIFDGEFGGYVQKYGPEKAAQAWFGGEGGIGKVNRKDSLGTSVGDYGKRFMAGLGQGGGAPTPTAAPVQTASLDPSAGVAQATGPNAPYPMEPSPYDDPQQRVALGGQPIAAPQPSVGGDPNQRIAQAFAPVEATNVTPKAGRVLPQDEQTQRILGPLLGKQPIGGEFAGMQPPETTAAIPQTQPVSAPAPQPAELPGTQIAGVGGAAGRTAPINGQGGQFPVAPQMPAQGAFPPAPAQPGQGLDLNRLIELAADPNTPELGQMIVQTLLKNRLTPPDSMDALNRQKTELDIQKSQRDLDTPAARPMTAQERQQWGIPAEDNRAYAMTPKGPELIGGSGQTINIGGEVEARKAELARLGIGPDDPRYAPYALTGKMPREDMQSLTATDKKAILEADEMVMTAQTALPILDKALELSGTAYDGVGASQRGWLAGNLGFEGGKATMEFDNLIQTQALNQLKAIFGAAPTEGERKILLDIAGSSSLPTDVRNGILERAKQAVERRLGMYKSRAEELRGGTFYKPDGGAAAPQGNAYKDKYGLD